MNLARGLGSVFPPLSWRESEHVEVMAVLLSAEPFGLALDYLEDLRRDLGEHRAEILWHAALDQEQDWRRYQEWGGVKLVSNCHWGGAESFIMRHIHNPEPRRNPS